VGKLGALQSLCFLESELMTKAGCRQLLRTSPFCEIQWKFWASLKGVWLFSEGFGFQSVLACIFNLFCNAPFKIDFPQKFGFLSGGVHRRKIFFPFIFGAPVTWTSGVEGGSSSVALHLRSMGECCTPLTLISCLFLRPLSSDRHYLLNNHYQGCLPRLSNSGKASERDR
jgi:hypothetical protein